MPVSLLTEIDRKADGEIDEEVKKEHQRLTTIVISPVSKLRLINHPDWQGRAASQSIMSSLQKAREWVPTYNVITAKAVFVMSRTICTSRLSQPSMSS